jgi:signal transduction histidine kinase
VRVPYASVLGQASIAMRRLILISLIVLLLGGLGAWTVSRSVTAPLNRLGAAADVVATGDYSRRTGVKRADEIGRLAASFDAMAAHVEAAHSELARRYEQSQHLATQLEQTNQQLTLANAEAEAARTDAQTANRVKSEFLATMSHEIRTPINAVVGYTDLLDLGVKGALSDGQRAYVERIRLSSEHLISVVNDVLDFAKIESGQMRIQRQAGAAVDEITAAIAMLQVDAATKKTSVSVDCRANARYLGDPQRVQQILLNLLSNAIKFTCDGGRVTVTCEQEQGIARLTQSADPCTCITVADNGPGIETTLHEAIFHPFVQSEGGYTRPYGGTGLGLAISRSLARMMSGDITVRSAPGRGSAFTLRLPQPEHAQR